MTQISNDIVEDITALLRPHNGKLWATFNCVLQDDDTQLLITIVLQDDGKLYDKSGTTVHIKAPTPEQLDLIRRTVSEIVDPRVPRRDKDYSWVACILVKKMVDSVLGGMNGYPIT